MDWSGLSHFNSAVFAGAKRALLVLWAIVLLVVSVSAKAEPVGQAAFTVDANYPGGNIIVQQIEGDTVHLRSDLRETEGWWFYWNFRVRGAQGRELTFDFGDPGPVGVRGPAVSLDGGESWSWYRDETTTNSFFTYSFAKDVAEVRFCLGMPYQAKELQRFLARCEAGPHLQVDELCQTAKGRSVERLCLGRLDGRARFHVLFTARHHACEMMASYVLEGALAAILADSEDGRWFRQNVEVLAIPFMDKDGVVDGDQGKNRKPRDHNRDYVGKSIYASVAELRDSVPKWLNGKSLVAVDLHCPYIRGQYNEVIYMVGSADESIWAEQRRLANILEDCQRGPLVYRASDNLPFGTAWNTAGNFSQGKSFRQWASELDGTQLATTFEIPYANAGGRVVTAQSARMFGQSLAAAMRRYLEQTAAQAARRSNR